MTDDQITPILVAVARLETKLDTYAADAVALKAAQAATDLKVTALMAAEALRTGQAQGRGAMLSVMERLPGVIYMLVGTGALIWALH